MQMYSLFWERNLNTRQEKISFSLKAGEFTSCIYMILFCNYRLDAGTFGTMGVGVGFAIAAAVYCRDYAPDKRVICIQGDSAFGFSGFEVETVCRLVETDYNSCECFI